MSEDRVQEQTRRSGILCHPTSLPGPHGIGSLGPECGAFLDFLARAGQSIWQILPLGPTGFGNSPYQAFSAFAGNPLLIDLRPLEAMGLLLRQELYPGEPFSQDHISYERVIPYKIQLLRTAFERLDRAPSSMRQALESFQTEQAAWLPDYALFMALEQRFEGESWTEWPQGIAMRRPEALARWREELSQEIAFQCFLQFLFHEQWQAVREYAHGRGIHIVGDMPIFVGQESADVWCHRDLFQLNGQGLPIAVAGVPPDYFSETGQLWGNPLYDWECMAENDYAWWLDRLEHTLSMVDMVRLDHFRGFVAYWRVPADQTTAINGEWVPGPGHAFFDAVKRRLGAVPIIAEDLGLITEEVEQLRDALGLPGMKVLQFAYDGNADNPHLPHNYPVNCVAYTGTHDNDTTAGWFAKADENTRRRVRTYTGCQGDDVVWPLIRTAMTSVARYAVFPLQDPLELGSRARMNHPGKPHGNWAWRFRPESLTKGIAQRLYRLVEMSGRLVRS